MWLTELVPRICLACELYTRRPLDLCEHCERALPWNRGACGLCGEALPNGHSGPCRVCRQDAPPFGQTLAQLRFATPVDQWVHAIKASGSPVHVRTLCALAAGVIEGGVARWPDVLVPIPASRRRLARRGHNQAVLIARSFGRQFGIPVCSNSLTRARHTAPQQGQGRAARRRNLRGAFAVQGSPQPHIALVDDVLTTTATCREAARALLCAGAERVDVWVLARATLGR